MAEYEINKGVGRSVEFKGLKAQYLFIFAGGLLGTIVLVAILYLLGVNQFLCLIIGFVCAAFIAWKTFAMNKKYGQHGLMKISARKSHPRYLINRKRPRSLLKRRKRA
ncbi:MAG: hypothetical protein BWZ00_00971 [Bacteroidetes bacterium ADurb.BinA174]|nr:MAG: hypothetical protein BWZ00_00971 [Bacteroidetes bacterium ADurb.BinA174]